MVTDKRIVLIAELMAREGSEAEVMSVLEEYAVHVRAEPGNQTFECYQTKNEPLRFIVYEIYSHETAFQAHLAAPMNSEVNARLSKITECGSSLTFLTPFGNQVPAN